MVYNKILPPVRHLLSLARQTRFPATRQDITVQARTLGAPAATLDFLQLFPADETFPNRNDFVTRCEEVELLIEQQRAAPEETLRSPQD